MKDLVVDTKQIPKGTLPGAYKARLSIMDGEKLIAGFELKLTIKGI